MSNVNLPLLEITLMSSFFLATAGCRKWSSGNQGLRFESSSTFLVIYAFSLYQERKV